jgi:hypothetical protein
MKRYEKLEGHHWNLTSNYVPDLLLFLDGVSWDVDDDAKQMALSVAGEYLRTHEDEQVGARLLRFANDPTERELLRELAVSALARALSDGWQEIPPASRRTSLSDSWSRSVLHRAAARWGNAVR